MCPLGWLSRHSLKMFIKKKKKLMNNKKKIETE